MYGYLKNTAGQTLGFSLFSCSGTPVTGATVIAERSIDGGSLASVTGTVSEIGNGLYCLNMSQADTNGNAISFLFSASYAATVEKSIVTASADGVSGAGVHFKEPWLLHPTHVDPSLVQIRDMGGNVYNPGSTAFFTEIARRGLQDTTNWSANTWKTVLSVPSGKGLVASYIGCQAGGAETHTVEFTVDGVVSTITIAGMASGERAVLHANMWNYIFFSDAGYFADPYSENLDADRATFSGSTAPARILPWSALTTFGTPLLRFDQSLQIRAKHSANVTNATATAYSAVMYKLGL